MKFQHRREKINTTLRERTERTQYRQGIVHEGKKIPDFRSAALHLLDICKRLFVFPECLPCSADIHHTRLDGELAFLSKF